MNTGGLKWPYLNSILKSWHEQGLLTLEKIEAGDRMPEKAARSQAKPGYNVQHHDDDLSDIQRAAIRRMLQNGEG